MPSLSLILASYSWAQTELHVHISPSSSPSSSPKLLPSCNSDLTVKPRFILFLATIANASVSATTGQWCTWQGYGSDDTLACGIYPVSHKLCLLNRCWAKKRKKKRVMTIISNVVLSVAEIIKSAIGAIARWVAFKITSMLVDRGDREE